MPGIQKRTGAKLALANSAADVVILGWRLDLLADNLQENDLAAVRALATRP